MTNPIVGAINGGIIGMITGAGSGFLHYPIFCEIYPTHVRRLYDKNGGVMFMTALGGGIGGCIGGAIGGFHSARNMNDGGVLGGLTGGAICGVAGSIGIIISDSNKNKKALLYSSRYT